MIIEGRARVLGDDINSDYIISSRRKRATIDELQLRQFLLEAIDPAFAASVSEGDILVAGRNFGCGSAMETAVTVILASGIRAVLARTFARSFYRNAINNGLVVVECDTAGIAEGHRLRVQVEAGTSLVKDLVRQVDVAGRPMPEIMQRILLRGGLVEFLRAGERFG